MRNKAVITILGLAGGRINKRDDKLEAVNFNTKHKYYFEDEKLPKTPNYTNTLSFLIDKYSESYKIVPLFTKEAKLVQSKILKETEDKKEWVDKIFDDRYLIEDENDFEKLLALINKAIDRYDKVVVDITHGFRHMPILMTISLIMENIKNIDKIEHIWFAKEKVKAEKDVTGVYPIIDLKNYLDLASLSLIIKTFGDNYTISSNIELSNDKYKSLIKDMQQFSRDIMALSVNNLFFNTYPQLKKSLEKLVDDILLGNDIKKLLDKLEIFEYHKEKRYKLYYKLAKYLLEKDYLLQSVALISEAKGFYVKSSIKSINNRIKQYIERIEQKIENEEIYNERFEEKYTYYQLNQECKNLYSNNFDRIEGIIMSRKNNKYKYITDLNIIREIKNNMGFDYDFKEYIWHDLRNQLVHANSIENIENVKEQIENELKRFEKFCIEDNILKCKL